MIKRATLPGLPVILSKDDYGFAAVLEDLPRAKHVFIATLHVLTYEGDLLEYIRGLPAATKVWLITNIPGRFEEYRGRDDEAIEYRKGEARRTISKYREILDPTKFKCDLSVFFNFQTHAKIIATENIAYVGSMNFSKASRKNFECGVLIEGSSAVTVLVNDVFRELQNASIPYHGAGDELGDLLINLEDDLRDLEELQRRIREGFYTEHDLGRAGYAVGFDWQNATVSDELIHFIENLAGSVKSAIEDQPQRLADVLGRIDLAIVDRLLHVTRDGGALQRAVDFDTQAHVQLRLEEEFPDPEHLDDVIQNATDEALEIHDEIMDSVEVSIIALEADIAKLIEALGTAIRELKLRQAQAKEIDNTRRPYDP